MPLFQKPPATPEELERSRPLGIPPAEVAEMDEPTWYARAYRGEGVPQLTLRAVLMGSALGFLLAFTNLYVGLKTGWALNVAITACLLSFSLWTMFLKVGVAKSPMTILENNCMQSTASAAGYSTGSTFVSAISAMLMISATTANPAGRHLPWPVLVGWTLFLAMLGVTLAIPMKRNMINHERLPFPSGIASAVTLQSLYSRGDEALKKAKAMLYGALGAGLLPLLMDLKLVPGKDGQRAPLVPAETPAFDWLPARGTDPKTGAALVPSDWTVVLDHKLVMVAAGVLVGMRVSLSMVIGGLLLAFSIGPDALVAGAVKAPGAAWRQIGIWVGAAILVSSGLLHFALGWRTIGRALRGLLGRRDGGAQAHAGVEVPGSWVAMGMLVAGGGAITIGHVYFQIPWFYGALAVVMTFFLALVACRATGESDVTPISAMGKLMQLTYGVLIPQNATANLMTASITGNAAASAADLLTDLKSGYLLGANPRRQFIAQFLGIFAGTAATVWGFFLLVPDATVLTGRDGHPPAFPAPSAQAWLAVARVFEAGIDSLHPMARAALGWGSLAGVLLVLAETLLPRWRKWLPSATGIGLGFILPFQYPLSFLIGASLHWLWTNRHHASSERYAVAVASGIIAGESIVGVVVAAVNNLR